VGHSSRWLHQLSSRHACIRTLPKTAVQRGNISLLQQPCLTHATRWWGGGAPQPPPGCSMHAPVGFPPPPPPTHTPCPADFLANEKGVPKDQVKSWTPYPGGAPCNVATCLSHLGVPTLFVGALGKDDRGEELMALMKGGAGAAEAATCLA
jgi:hypothetical protein